jgi:hypothetical protein
MKKPVKNLPASVRQKLLNQAYSRKRDFNELLNYYGMERFLYRLARSKYSEKFILKGALLFAVWDVPSSQTTMDIDLLGKVKNDLAELVAVVKEICSQTVEEDGIRFELSTITAERIVVDADYKGVRVNFMGFLEKSRYPCRLILDSAILFCRGLYRWTFPPFWIFPLPV